MGDQDLKVASGEAFATSATLGFQSFLGFGDDAGVVGAAIAGVVVALTSTAIEVPLAAEERMKGAGDMVIAEALALRRMECNTWIEGSGWAAVHRLAFHVDHAVVIEQKQVSLTVGYDTRSGDSPLGSLSQPP